MNVFQRLNTSLFLACIAILIISCNDQSTVGSDLVDDDLIQVEFTDTFSIIASTNLK